MAVRIGSVLQRSVRLFPVGFLAMGVAVVANLFTGSIGPCGARPNLLMVFLAPAYPAFWLVPPFSENGWEILVVALVIGSFLYALLFSIARELILYRRSRRDR